MSEEISLNDILNICQEFNVKCEYRVDKSTFSSNIMFNPSKKAYDIHSVKIPNIDIVNKWCRYYGLSRSACLLHVRETIEHEVKHVELQNFELSRCPMIHTLARSVTPSGRQAINFCENIVIEKELEDKYREVHFIDCNKLRKLTSVDIERVFLGKTVNEAIDLAISLSIKTISCYLEDKVKNDIDKTNLPNEFKKFIKKLLEIGSKTRNIGRDELCNCLADTLVEILRVKHKLMKIMSL